MNAQDIYEILENNCEGVCRACGGIQGGVEPDAEGYDCENCGEPAVVGVEIALFENILPLNI